MEATLTSNRTSAEKYMSIINQMSDSTKLDLIVLLTQSLRHGTKQSVSANDFYGIWADDGVDADYAAEEIRNMRSFNRHTVQL